MNSFQTKTTLAAAGVNYHIHGLEPVYRAFPAARTLPFSLKILLENLVRSEDGSTVTRREIEALAQWNPAAKSENEIAFAPARVLLQDFTGVPAVVDLAAMRDAMAKLGGDPQRIGALLWLHDPLGVDHQRHGLYQRNTVAWPLEREPLARRSEIETARLEEL